MKPHTAQKATASQHNTQRQQSLLFIQLLGRGVQRVKGQCCAPRGERKASSKYETSKMDRGGEGQSAGCCRGLQPRARSRGAAEPLGRGAGVGEDDAERKNETSGGGESERKGVRRTWLALSERASCTNAKLAHKGLRALCLGFGGGEVGTSPPHWQDEE